MLLYITAEDVFGSDTPKQSGPRPLHTVPATVAGLYDLGLRHHVRQAAMLWPGDGGFAAVPDWKLDRLTIRLALFARERLGLEPGERVAVFGRLGWLWSLADFAMMGFGMVPVGVEHDLRDDALMAVLSQAAPRLVIATDPASAERLREIPRHRGLDKATLVAEGLPQEEGLLPLARVLDLGSTLDTAERAQAFRAVSRQVPADAEALWHAAPAGLLRLTHREAMTRIEPRLRAHPARDGDRAYLAGPRVSVEVRLALAAFVGDGRTAVALGRPARTSPDLAELRPHVLLGDGDWVEGICEGRGPRWPGGVDRRWARKRIQEALGGRARRVETERPVSASAARALAAAGVEAALVGGAPAPISEFVH
jgi:AMP-binding enzyme